MQRARKINHLVDKVAAGVIAAGGLGVIGAILLIAFYLIYEVVPMFKPASINPSVEFALPVPEAGPSIYLASEEQVEVGFRLGANGRAVFFSLENGDILADEALPLPEGVEVSSLTVNSDASRVLGLGLSDGGVLLLKHDYRISYPNDKRKITPVLRFPYGEEPIQLADEPLQTIAMRDTEASLTLVAQGANGSHGMRFEKEENFLSGEVSLVPEELELPVLPPMREILLGPDARWMFAMDKAGLVHVLNLDSATPQVSQVVQAADGELTDMAFLLGNISLITLNNDGNASQWFLVRDEDNAWQLEHIRVFEGRGVPIEHIAMEQRRKGFVTLDQDGYVAIFNATASRKLLEEPMIADSVNALHITPRANALLVETDSQVHLWRVYNEHPEVSWSSLWGKVWYEGYPEPAYIWQSSAANNDFEPKLSLMPLAFGTLKAAFYAMLLATPIALAGAIFTAYFMAPGMRTKVKPVIELMEALPTVILGFLAGLWLAPFMEANMVGIFTLILLLPVATLLAAFGWQLLPISFTSRVPAGWQGAILVPVVIFTAWFSFAISGSVERGMFGGDFLAWLTQDLGVAFDQRNALVVGIAMGFAVIPTIFSIAEDAIFSVPKHLTMGSLALGAQPWQTLVGVVLPTASPGIFSALMIGFGRAVGETMIVLMATGNTPIMDANIFEGMRTLAANIAVEVPETEVDSTHYRVLFLAGFVLFAFTFVFNTIAEVVRQRLREKYGNI